MNAFHKRVISLLLCAVLIFTLSACGKSNESDIEGIFTNMKKISYSKTYTQLDDKKQNDSDNWRQGMVSGNGVQGVITSGAPFSDTFIFQNINFVMPNQNVRYCPITSYELEGVKQNIIKGENITDNASYDALYGFHPGGQLRVAVDDKKANNYIRYTDYETGVVGVRYENEKGVWTRETFTSMSDGAVITRLGASDKGEKISVTLSVDDLSTMTNFGNSDEANIQYKKLVGEDCEYISLISHYPDYENSELQNGGYGTLTFVAVEGGDKERVTLGKVKDSQCVSSSNDGIKITDADKIYLITFSDRIYNMGSLDSFSQEETSMLADSLFVRAKAVYDKYASNSIFDFEKALDEHINIYQPQFDAVSIELGDEDSYSSNEELISKQQGKSKLNSELMERAYYQGRYALLCCSGHGASRLYGMWTGEFDTGWGSKYTMDANLNLQVASLNTGNISSAPIGYAYFILRQLPEWEENALATHGYSNCIQAPVHYDGDKAVITETCYSYPFRYWNAGASWLIQPLYETLQCYGNIQIPITGDIDINMLRSVLSPTNEPLTDEAINKLNERGYLLLEEDILLPVLIKSTNYWRALMTPEYYTDSKGGIHYEKGKKELADGEYYCILPSYSPENNPANYPSPSAANSAVDIAACKDNFNMLESVLKDINPDCDTSEITKFTDKIPPYLYDDTGAIKEWATTAFEENNEHRHLSHLYCVWPLAETQYDENLKKACEQAIKNRASENNASHALVHRSLISARLKDRKDLTKDLSELMGSNIYYDSLMTNHDFSGESCYCTDFAIGYVGIINESLVYSNKGEIELLPALTESGCNKGEIKGLVARTQATIDSLKWNIKEKTVTATITSAVEQTITVTCSMSTDNQQLDFSAGETKTVQFIINS